MEYFFPNEIVHTSDGLGRVIHHNYFTKDVHVMLQTGPKCWIMKKYFQMYVKKHEGLLWPANRPFNSNYVSYVQYYRY